MKSSGEPILETINLFFREVVVTIMMPLNYFTIPAERARVCGCVGICAVTLFFFVSEW